MADLPEPASVPERARTPPSDAASALGPGTARARDAAVAALTLVLLGVLLIAGGGWPSAAVFEVVLEFALMVCAVGLIAAARRWWRMRGR